MMRAFIVSITLVLGISGISFAQESHKLPLIHGKSLEHLVSRKIIPTTPESFRSYDAQGSIYSIVFVNSEGRVEKVSIITGSGFKPILPFVEKALLEWRFEPLVKGGKAVPFRGLIQLYLQNGGVLSEKSSTKD
jgi:hypothetical protein